MHPQEQLTHSPCSLAAFQKREIKNYHNPNYTMCNVIEVPVICRYLSVCNENSTSLHSLLLNNLNPDTTIA